LSRALLQVGRPADAIDKLKDVLALDPNDGKSHMLMASALLTQGHYDEAKSHLHETLALQSDDIEAQTQLANLSLQLHQYGEAAELLRQIVARRPDDPDALKNYAWLLATAPEANLRNGARGRAGGARAGQFATEPIYPGYPRGGLCRSGRFPTGAYHRRDGFAICRSE
jgi:tetratricopeptide (TPR) repeat protein